MLVLCLAVASQASAHDVWIERLQLVLGEGLVAEEVLGHLSPREGMVVLERDPFEVELDADTFNRYLSAEGHDHGLRSTNSVRERVTRHLKAFVGRPIDRSFLRRFGTRLEIVPLTIPAAGKPFRVRVLLDGRPLPRAQVSFFSRREASCEGLTVRTNRRGQASAVLHPGFVLVRTTHIERGRDVDYQSDWTSLTFDVP